MNEMESQELLGATFFQADPQTVFVQDDMDENTDDSSHDNDKISHVLRDQDRFLPIANITKIMKKAIPENIKVAKDARECVQECVSEFISFITSEASDHCHTEKRKTVNGEDVLYAMAELGFDNYIEPMNVYLVKYREASKVIKVLGASSVFEDSAVEDTLIKSPPEDTSPSCSDFIYTTLQPSFSAT